MDGGAVLMAAVGVDAGLLLLTLARLFSFALGRGFERGATAVVVSQCWVVAAYVSAGYM